jgi:5-methylcytosine-specific restriction endonuclease McrA
MRVHHSSAHGERLPNRECDACGCAFYSEHEQKYCSEKCREAGVSFAGAANPNYSGGKETTTCATCGTTFEYYPSEKAGRFCSECVESTDWRDPPSLDGTDNPRWKGGKLELACDVCGNEFERYPSNVTGDVAVCSEDCRREWLSESFTGDGHPNWRGGPVGNYGPGWNAVRREALDRDGHECVLCGTDAADLGRNPDVHHIVPVRVFAAAEDHDRRDAHTLDNVVTLCPGCHRKAEFGRIDRDELRCAAESTD